MSTAVAYQVPGASFDGERLEQRRKSLGASEIAAVAGLDPHRSALDVFLEKTGQVQPFAGNEFTEWGLRLEDAIARKYADAFGVAFEQPGTIVSPTASWMSATPDRLVVSLTEIQYATAPLTRYGLEIKNKSARQAAKWGEPGTDQVPHEIAAQCHWSMLVLRDLYPELSRWDCAALFGGNEYKCYVLAYNAEIAEDMQSIGWTFWRNHVLKGIAPAVDGSKSASEYLKRKFVRHGEEIREATREQDAWIRDLKIAREKRAAIEADEQLLENRLKDAIGDAAGIIGRSGRVTWKAPASGPISWKPVAEYLGAGKHPELVAQHTGQPARRFLPTFPKD